MLASLLLLAFAPPQVRINAPLARTPGEIVSRMLRIAGVSKHDTVYDLGAGDGRIVIHAARKFGARAVGIEIDPETIRVAKIAAAKAHVSHRVRFRLEDMFDADLRDATVVTLFLLPDVNIALRDKLRALRPGTRIVSHTFDMGDWKPDRQVRAGGTTIYLWVVRGEPSRQRSADRTRAVSDGAGRRTSSLT
jgi:SAM-dependent methyltransferase